MITARLAEPPLEAKGTVEVFDVALVNVLPSRTTLAGPAGSTFPLTLEVKDSAGQAIDMKAEVDDREAPKVATVDAAGLVTSVARGDGHRQGHGGRRLRRGRRRRRLPDHRGARGISR